MRMPQSKVILMSNAIANMYLSFVEGVEYKKSGSCELQFV